MNTKLRRVSSNFQKVKNWTKKVNLFDMDYIVVPINEDIHWYLAILVNVRYGICCTATKNPIHSIIKTEEGEGCSSSIKIEENCSIKTEEGCPLPQKPYLVVLNSLIDPAEDKHLAVREQLGEYLHLEYAEKHAPATGKQLSFNKATMEVVMPAMLPQQKGYIDCGLFLLHFAQLFLANPPRVINRRSSFRRWYPNFEIKHKRDEIRRVICQLAPQIKPSQFVSKPVMKKKGANQQKRRNKTDLQAIIEGMSLMGRTRRYSDSDLDAIEKDSHFSLLYRPRSFDSLVREYREKPVVLQPPTKAEMARFKRKTGGGVHWDF